METAGFQSARRSEKCVIEALLVVLLVSEQMALLSCYLMVVNSTTVSRIHVEPTLSLVCTVTFIVWRMNAFLKGLKISTR